MFFLALIFAISDWMTRVAKRETSAWHNKNDGQGKTKVKEKESEGWEKPKSHLHAEGRPVMVQLTNRHRWPSVGCKQGELLLPCLELLPEI
jgi:hypothetical protein